MVILFMLGIGDPFPEFKLEATDGKEVYSLSDKQLKGTWSVIFFYPEDFTFICPTEIKAFENYKEVIEIWSGQLFGVSVDDVSTHQEWINQELHTSYPLISDTGGKLSEAIGVLDDQDKRAHRATFILDPENVIQFSMVTSRNVGRSVEETIRVFKALQSGRQCPVDYQST